LRSAAYSGAGTFDAELLLEQPLVAAKSVGHRFACRSAVSLSNLANDRWLLPPGIGPSKLLYGLLDS